MGGTESQWLVKGTGVRQRSSLRRLLAELKDKNGGREKTDLAQWCKDWGWEGGGSEAGVRLEGDKMPLRSLG